MNTKNKILLLALCMALSSCNIVNTTNSNQGFQNSSTTENSSNGSQVSEESSNKESSTSNEQSSPSEENSSSEPSNQNSSSDSSSEDTSSDIIVDKQEGKIEVIKAGTSFENIYVEWAPYKDATNYIVYCDNKKIDAELIRNYGDFYRADIIGITSLEHEINIVPVVNNEEIKTSATTFKATPKAHVREGFAFSNNTIVGAYKNDGTLKDNAKILYINNNNKDTISATIKTGSSSTTNAVGVQNIISALGKGYETSPYVLRFLGNITDFANIDELGGDMLIDLGSGKYSKGLTIEGIGNDTTFNGFGIRIKNSNNVEIRNIGFMNCDSDEGDEVSLQQNNNYVWVHNNDFFYGLAGSDADQAKGDGQLDCKKSNYATFSFNHFWDGGKVHLLGNNGGEVGYLITYHHNWYDHSDSRHPRVRQFSTHVYNNYYDGNAKYGIGCTQGGNVFSEANYFRNCKYPMLISMQGSDNGTFSKEDGGIIKAYNNHIEGAYKYVPYSQNKTEFDAYDVSSRDEKIPSTVKTVQGSHTYDNFDTNASLMYKYNVQTPEDAKETVMEYAGRVEGGDFKWTFTAADDNDYDVNTALKNALLSYKGYNPSTNTPNQGGTDNPDDNPDDNEDMPEACELLSFEKLSNQELSSKLIVNEMVAITASSEKKVVIAENTQTYAGVKYTKMIKLGGGGNTSYRSIEIKNIYKCKIEVLALSSSSSTPRETVLLNSKGEQIGDIQTIRGTVYENGNTLDVAEFNVTEYGTYYYCSKSSGLNVYAIIITYK